MSDDNQNFATWERDVRNVWITARANVHDIGPFTDVAAKLARIMNLRQQRLTGQVISEDDRLRMASAAGLVLGMAWMLTDNIDEYIKMARQAFNAPLGK